MYGIRRARDGVSGMINIKNIEATFKKIGKIGKDFSSGFKAATEIDKLLSVSGNDMRNAALNMMKYTKRASWSYLSTESGKRHNPSAPGFPPAIDTGTLSNSYKFEVKKMRLEFGSTVEYSKWLENGTEKNGKGLAARPVLNPVVDAYKDGINEELKKIAPEMIFDIYSSNGVVRK